MRKAIVILIFILSNIGFGQEYKFDKAFTYNEARTEYAHQFTRVFMFNKENSDYYMTLITTDQPKKIGGYKCSIYDSKAKMLHHFFAKTVSGDLKFEYLNSSKEKDFSCMNNDKLFGLDYLNSNDKPEIKINRYNNLTEKKVIESCTVVMGKEVEEARFEVFLKSFYKNFNCCKSLKLSTNYIPAIINIDYADNKKSQINLTNVNEVSYSISINKEDLKFKN